MRIRDGFLKTELGGQTYVLPYGQRIVDYCEGISLNETGEILWRGLEAGMEKGELVSLLQREYGLGGGEEVQLTQDVEHFIKYLTSMGMLQEEDNEEYGWLPLYFAVGPLRVAYKGPEEIYQRYFQNFAWEDGEVDLTVQIACLPPRHHKNGRVILRSSEVVLMDVGEEYIFLFPGFSALNEMQVRKDGSYALLFCDADLMERDGEEIYHAIRFAVLVAASEKGMFFIHSASLLYQGKAWLFSGKSGTGKSTHTNLWRDAFGVELLNGDLNMLGMEDGEIIVYGQPWCGTSGICTRKAVPLGGITFLRQGRENVCQKLQMSEKILFLVQRMISPAWERELLERNVSFAEEVETHCPIWRLYCTPDREAAEVMKRVVDESLNG